MSIVLERKINYYETDRMGVVHHSNYIRYLEEARTFWLREIGIPFEVLEERGMTVPVLGVECTYKQHVTFADTILIKTFIKEYNGVKMTIGYDVTQKETGKTVVVAETRHCFTDRNLKPINLKKHDIEFSDKLEKLIGKE